MLNNKITLILSLYCILATTAFAQDASKMNVVGQIYFSSTPFSDSHEGSKNTFTSGENIYARIERSGKRLYEVLPYNNPDSTYEKSYLHYDMTVYKNGKLVTQTVGDNVWFIRDANWKKTGMNFDVLPDSTHCTTSILSLYNYQSYSDESNYRYDRRMPLGWLIEPERFSANGLYTVKVVLYREVMDDWGKTASESLWPCFAGEFELNFDTKDVGKIQKDISEVTIASVAARKRAEEARRAKLTMQREEEKEAQVNAEPVPKTWTAKTNPLVGDFTLVEVRNMFKREFPKARLAKIYVSPAESQHWQIEKNEFGVPKYKYTLQDVIIFYTGEDGKCGYRVFQLRRYYDSGGRYSKELGYSIGDREQVACAKMK